ncbi:MAG: hypothetical protein QN161_12855, partial [Armatimonadota bacterium]|nr:hypothetical protein [Armatimonadota bacterium]
LTLPGDRPYHTRQMARVSVAAATAVLVAAGFFLPVWELEADVRGLGMFREGFLHLQISGTGVAGDVQSFNRFSGQFGIRPLRPEQFLELRAYPVAAAAAVALPLAWATQGRLWQRRLALVFLWGLPAGAVGLTQLRLALMAYTRDPMAPYYMDVSALLLPVFGVKKILGATLYTRPGAGFLCLVVAALVFTLVTRRR